VCVVSNPFHSLFELDRQSQPSRRGGHCWKLHDTCLLLADNLVLLGSSEQVLQYALDRFAAACGYAGIKSGTERSRYYVSPDAQASVCCK